MDSSCTYNANDLPVLTTLNGGLSQAQETAQYDPDSRLTRLQAVGPTTDTAPAVQHLQRRLQRRRLDHRDDLDCQRRRYRHPAQP